MVSKGQFVGLDWNHITRLHSQEMIGTQEVKNVSLATFAWVQNSRKWWKSLVKEHEIAGFFFT